MSGRTLAVGPQSSPTRRTLGLRLPIQILVPLHRVLTGQDPAHVGQLGLQRCSDIVRQSNEGRQLSGCHQPHRHGAALDQGDGPEDVTHDDRPLRAVEQSVPARQHMGTSSKGPSSVGGGTSTSSAGELNPASAPRASRRPIPAYFARPGSVAGAGLAR